MEQFEQLLTCAICLDRYRNPKLLPCQHSFCMEPCMDGLVDYVRRQVKCPECRAEHRIPYQGVQGFPTNVTLQRFLELHIEITGELPDPTSGQIMERCNVCSEKSYCSVCVHCEKKICADCKGAHMDILRREIARINNQVRRAIHRLEDALSLVEKNSLSLQQNCSSVSEEIDEIYRRLNKALKDRTEFLRGEIDRYLSMELRNLSTLKENLELEISNIQSNCDLADKHMTEAVEWDDSELMDAKEIFLKTVEFIRNFEYENADYNRRVRFSMSTDPNQLVLHVAGYGELTINMPHQPFTGVGGGSGSIAPSASSSGLLQPPGGPGLMRSKSDHRLASQFRQQDERGGYDRGGYGDGSGDPSGTSGRVSPLGGRKFGERYPQNRGGNDRYDQQQSRYGGRCGGGGDYSGEFESPYDNDGNRPRSKYRSRFSRHHGDNADSDNDTQGNRSVRFSEGHQHKERERVLDTEDVARGPLSGITRLYDSPRVMKRLQESEQRGKKKEKEPVQPVPQPQLQVKAPQQVPKRTQRQVSEEDEISKIKRANKAGASASTTTTETTTPTSDVGRPVSERVAALKTSRDNSSEDRDSSQPSSPTTRAPPSDLSPTRKAPGTEVASSDAESDDGSSVSSLQQSQRKNSKPTSGSVSRRSSGSSDVPGHKKATRSASSDSSTSESSAASSSAVRNTSTTVAEPKQKPFASRGSTDKGSPGESPAGSGASTPRNRLSSTGSDTPKKPFQSRFLANRQASTASSVDKQTKEEEEDEEEESESSSESEETDSEDESDDASKKKPETTPAKSTVEKSDIGPLLARSAQARDTSEATRRNSRDDSTTAGYGKSRYDSSSPSSYRPSYSAKEEPATGNKYLNRTRGSVDEDSSSRYGSGSGYTSRFLNKSKSSAAMSPDEGEDSGGRKYSSTATTAGTTTDDSSFAVAAVAAGSCPRSQYLQKRRQQFKIGSRGSEPGCFTWPRGIAVGPDNSIVVADSSNHRVQVFDANGIFVKEFGSYGNAEGEFDCLAGVAVNRIGQFIIADRYNHRIQVLDPAGRFLRAFGSQGTADGRFNYPWGITTDALGFIYVCDKENHRVQVFQSDGTFVGKFGSCGSKPGQLEHPHYIAVSNTNRVIVSDSNNHRIQIFDVNGRVLTTFGTEGSDEGQFKFPRNVVSRRSIKRTTTSAHHGKHHHHHHNHHHHNNVIPPPASTNLVSKVLPPHPQLERSGRGRPRVHIRSRLGQQPHTDLPSRWDIPSGVRMLGVRGRGVQGTGRDSSHVQWQHPSVRQGESSHTSVLSSPEIRSRPVLINGCVIPVPKTITPRAIASALPKPKVNLPRSYRPRLSIKF
ncbi:RING finger protein nhl-1 isoform X5 [Periplaneta americana]|uniref:RING finger protein nhl-1 isoform X5 n=1 Tax=Periplaneta americana TaxID=6978 RepID=UPI0037E8ED59